MSLNASSISTYCLQKKNVVVDSPWGPGTKAFKINGKIFAALDEDLSPNRLNIKCGAEKSIKVQLKYEAIYPHRLHKKTWVTILLDGSVPDDDLMGLLDCAYEMMVRGKKK